MNLLITKNKTSILTPKEIHYTLIKSDSIVLLEKGAFLERNFDIYPFYPLKETGNYSIQAQFIDKVFIDQTEQHTLETNSNSKTITIQ